MHKKNKQIHKLKKNLIVLPLCFTINTRANV